MKTLEARVIGLEKLRETRCRTRRWEKLIFGWNDQPFIKCWCIGTGGFATTADAYREFLDQSGLNARIQAELAELNVDDVNALAETGAKIRQWIVETPLTPA